MNQYQDFLNRPQNESGQYQASGYFSKKERCEEATKQAGNSLDMPPKLNQNPGLFSYLGIDHI
jgi:hypothetical protein